MEKAGTGLLLAQRCQQQLQLINLEGLTKSKDKIIENLALNSSGRKRFVDQDRNQQQITI